MRAGQLKRLSTKELVPLNCDVLRRLAWIFIGKTDTEPEASPDAKNQLTGKNTDTRRG